VGGVASDSEGMPQFQILICYCGFPDLKVGDVVMMMTAMATTTTTTTTTTAIQQQQ